MTDAPPVADYQVKIETLCLGGVDFDIRSLLDRQQYSDPDGVAERAGISSASWPLFGLVWPSARILAGIVQALPLVGRRVLEIGCGLGLASLVMRRRGADITASDLHPLAAAFMAENLRLNRLEAIAFRTGNWADADPDLGAFDLIVGSDVLYERDLPGLLADYIDRHSSPSVEVIIVDPDRGNRAAFNHRMAGLGYRHTETRAAAQLESGEPYKGRILNYRRG
ncbi:MAG: methyltransferase domain-containing protein [Gallionellaceae bacterium]|nr:methyltransferase domain-containing protein [Gallionellaceae bacterium]